MKIKVNHFLESIVFSYEMGLTISQWAGVELSLGKVVSCFFHDKSIRASFIGFHSIQNFQAKLAYADNVLKSHIKIIQEFSLLTCGWCQVKIEVQIFFQQLDTI